MKISVKCYIVLVSSVFVCFNIIQSFQSKEFEALRDLYLYSVVHHSALYTGLILGCRQRQRPNVPPL